MATFTNQATLSYNGNIINSNIVTGEIVEVLSADKTAVTPSYRPGDKITYIVSIVNSGATPLTGITVSDDLGAYGFETTTLVPLDYEEGSIRYYADGVLQAAPAIAPGPPLQITGITVPALGNAIIVYEATANDYANGATGANITNTATISGGGITEPIEATETVTANNEALLSITKSLSPDTVSENGQLTYTFLIQNFGNTEIISTDNATVTDVFNPVLNPIAVSYNGTVWTAGTNYTYNSLTGEFATLPGQITVPAATYTQNTITGVWEVTPGVAVLRVTGTV